MAISAKEVFQAEQNVLSEMKLESRVKSLLEAAYSHFSIAESYCIVRGLKSAKIDNQFELSLVRRELLEASKLFLLAVEYDLQVESYAKEIEKKLNKIGQTRPKFAAISAKEQEIISASENFSRHLREIAKMLSVILRSDFNKIWNVGGYFNPADKIASGRMYAKFKFIEDTYETLNNELAVLFDLENYCKRMLEKIEVSQ